MRHFARETRLNYAAPCSPEVAFRTQRRPEPCRANPHPFDARKVRRACSYRGVRLTVDGAEQLVQCLNGCLGCIEVANGTGHRSSFHSVYSGSVMGCRHSRPTRIYRGKIAPVGYPTRCKDARRSGRFLHGGEAHLMGVFRLVLIATLLLPPSSLGAEAPRTFRNPFPKPIAATDGAVTVGVVEFATLPIVNDHPAQMMKMADEPGAGRLFVNDMGGILYGVSYDGGSITPYLDLKEPRWGVDPIPTVGGRGFQSFAFHPQFAETDAPGFGRFYTFGELTRGSSRADFWSRRKTPVRYGAAGMEGA